MARRPYLRRKDTLLKKERGRSNTKRARAAVSSLLVTALGIRAGDHNGSYGSSIPAVLSKKIQAVGLFLFLKERFLAKKRFHWQKLF